MPRHSEKEMRRREIFNLFVISYMRRGNRHSMKKRWLAIYEALVDGTAVSIGVTVGAFGALEGFFRGMKACGK